jgi:hypothetical protein
MSCHDINSVVHDPHSNSHFYNTECASDATFASGRTLWSIYPLSRVEKAGGKVLLNKTFLSEEAGHIAFFTDTEGNKIGLHSTN